MQWNVCNMGHTRNPWPKTILWKYPVFFLLAIKKVQELNRSMRVGAWFGAAAHGSGVGEEFGENWQAEKRTGGRGFVRVYEREVRGGARSFLFFIIYLFGRWWFYAGKKKSLQERERERERESLILLKIVNFASMIFKKWCSLIEFVTFILLYIY